MSKIINKKENIFLSKVCFGHHGQTSVILQQISYYFSCKSVLSDIERQILLKVICCNVKHLLELSKGQKFFSYEKNTYSYYKEKNFKKEKGKKILLDVLSWQTLLTKEYERFLQNNRNEFGDKLKAIISQSKECERVIKEQLKV